MVAIIPDGNRRSAARIGGISGIRVHQRGYANILAITQYMFEQGDENEHVEELVIWTASESNLTGRSAEEVRHICTLGKHELRARMRSTEKVAFVMRGAWREFVNDPILDELAQHVETKTAPYVALTKRRITALFGYDGETDVEQAAQKLHDAGIRPTKELILQNLGTYHIGNVDLLIRTGVEGDPHDSDAFLPLQRKHTKHFQTPVCWPEFSGELVDKAFADYASRPSREGK